MSSETIVTAIFLIASIVAAGILTTQLFPAIYTVTGSVSSSTHSADQSLRTDFSIVNTFSGQGTQTSEVWIKNTGTSRISTADLLRSNLFIGSPNDFEVLSQSTWIMGVPGPGMWNSTILDATDGYWETGETLDIRMNSLKIPPNHGDVVFFELALPDGTKPPRSSR